jgi:uncharacterized protein
MSGPGATWVHLLISELLLSRLLHPLGMYAAPNTLQFRVGRVGGITITLVLLPACALTILARANIGHPIHVQDIVYTTILSHPNLILTL